MALLIRDYVAGDRPALERLAAEVVRDGTVFPFERIEGVLAYWLGEGVRTYVAEDGGALVGSYVLKPVQADRGAHVANAGYMVQGEQRGRGIGEALGRHSFEQARALGYRAMQFNYVVSTNRSAVRLWERLGMRVMAELPGAFRHPRDGFTSVYVMYREL